MKTNSSTFFVLLFSILTLVAGFYFNEDSSGSGGYIADFNNTWGYIQALKNNLFVLPTQWTAHTPLHYILISKLNILINSELVLRLFFCITCLIIPYLFFLCLKIKFPKLDINNLVLLSSIIIILPAFRSSIIWLNAHATALIFFLIFLYFFLIWEKKNYETKISKNIILQIVFLALTVYTRQYYAYFYAYLMLIYFKKFNLKNFLIISSMVAVLAIPGFILIFYESIVLKTTFDKNLSNTLLISASIISFYLIPFYLIFNFKNQKKFELLNITKKQYRFFLFLLALIIILNLFFNYNQKIGGGFFLKLSYLTFNNNIIFLISSFLGLFFLYELYKEDKNNIFLILIFLFGFSAYMIFQKYFEPLFLILLILMLKSEMIVKFISRTKNIYYLYIYFLFYLAAAIINNIFKITKTLI